jgi:signal transduction histidine kinase/ActR/RegA family two-component response regulator
VYEQGKNTAERHLTVPILVPRGLEGIDVGLILKRERIPAVSCGSIDELVGWVMEGCGPAVVADEAFTTEMAAEFLSILNGEPGWSDLPLVILAGRGGLCHAGQKLGRRRGTTVLQQPVDPSTFVGIVRSAVESRKRQYLIRDLLADQRKLNEALERRAEQLQQLALELSAAEHRERERVAQVLHDHLQQILAAAKMGLGSMRRHQVPRDVKPLLAEVDGLLSEAIDASRTLSYDLSPPILRHSGLREAVRWLAREMRKKHGLRVHVRARIHEKDLSSPLQNFLFQAVRELLFNVVKHGETGEAEVTLETEDSHLTLCVRDDGKGFELAALKVEGGNSGGIGLLSLRERVSALGGRMEIESRPGDGSRFEITLPLMPEPLSDSVRAPKSIVPDGTPLPTVTQTDRVLRVLLADDHRVMRQGLVSLLANEGDIEVVGEADNGVDAVEKADQLRPDVVVMDVSMPVLDGIGATRRLRAELPEIEVIGLSMFEEGDIERKMLEAGAAAYLTKSGPSTLLLSAIRACRKGETAGVAAGGDGPNGRGTDGDGK